MASTLQTPIVWAEQLLNIASTAVASTTGGAIPRAFVSAGLPALDCCPQLTVHVAQWGILPTFATGALTPGHRRTVGAVRFIRYAVTVVRCSPTQDDKGNPPPEAAQEAAAAVVNEDAFAIIDATVAADYAGVLFGGTCREFYFDGASSLDPQGGCVGWTINFRASIDGLPSTP